MDDGAGSAIDRRGHAEGGRRSRGGGAGRGPISCCRRGAERGEAATVGGRWSREPGGGGRGCSGPSTEMRAVPPPPQGPGRAARDWRRSGERWPTAATPPATLFRSGTPGRPASAGTRSACRLAVKNPAPDTLPRWRPTSTWRSTTPPSPPGPPSRTYGRKRPGDQGRPLPRGGIALPDSPSDPSEHRGRRRRHRRCPDTSTPEAAAELAAKAREHARARTAAGVEFPSDFDAGFNLGTQVASKVAVLDRCRWLRRPLPGTTR